MTESLNAESQAKIRSIIAAQLEAAPSRVKAAIDLLDEGATVPFIARYRKEVTGALDDTQLRTLEERLGYLRELEERRGVILSSIKDQEKLTPELERRILKADTKTRLEDLYLPYRPKRRTKAQIAREAGLEPLGLRLWKEPHLDPERTATAYLNPEKNIDETKDALQGALFILMEQFAEDADLLGRLRTYLWKNAYIRATLIKGKQEEAAKFSDYFEYAELLQHAPSHRVLALLRGNKEGFLKLEVVPDRAQLQDGETDNTCERMIARRFDITNRKRPADAWLQKVVSSTWKVKLHPHLKVEMIGTIREKAELEAIEVFAKNLKDLLMAAPAGPRPTMGLDPGLRTGVKVVVVDDTGKLAAQDTIYPHPPKKQWRDSLVRLERLCRRHQVSLVSIGNGTGSRETDRLVADLLKANPDLKPEKVMVSEAGASVYSASALAAEEFPDVDVSIRGAISIARRLQDPLAELVKIEPKAIGVGQYQHDVNQTRLARSLGTVIEDCVNAVGVDINTASAPLLARVSGLSRRVAQNIVAFRDSHGRFVNRNQIKQVPRLGDKAFEQAAGFLRIMDGDNPLDASAVHPEAYVIARRIAKLQAKSLEEMIGNQGFLKSLKPSDYIDDRFGIPTVSDILFELEKPGRDPRPQFRTANFQEGVETIADLVPGMVLEGVVSNVTNFGAFVDLGVHQDGLVHISAMSHRFIKDPREVVKTGEIVEVKVMQIDIRRRRIGLSMRLDDVPGDDQPSAGRHPGGRHPGGRHSDSPSKSPPKARNQSKAAPSGFGSALSNALKSKDS